MANGNDGNSGTPPGLSPEALEALAEAQKERNRLLTKTDEKLKELRQNESEYNNLLRLQAEAIEKNTTLQEEIRRTRRNSWKKNQISEGTKRPQ